MSDTRLQLDDLQVARQTMGVLAEYAEILWEALKETGIPSDIAEQMLLTWWNTTLASASSPDLSALMESITKLTLGEDEE